MYIDKQTMRLPESCYFPQAQDKSLIVLHFTAGPTARGAYDHWRAQTNKIATAYLVDVGGSIYECFPPEMWAYHMSYGGGAARNQQRSIGIEIANWGPLRKDPTGEWLCAWPGGWTRKVCRVEERERYLAVPYRGEKYWAAMPTVQQQAVGHLARKLCADFDIPLHASRGARDGDFNPVGFSKYSGIASHSNFAAKHDVGPAFFWGVLGADGDEDRAVAA